MENPYKVFLDEYFDKLLGFRHFTNRVIGVLTKDVETYLPDGAQLHLGSALVISDWTGPTDSGSEINFHTGTFKKTLKEKYPDEVKRIISRECCLMYAQSFEALETLLKDMMFHKARRSKTLTKFILTKKKNILSLTRGKMPSGDHLFNAFKEFGGKSYKAFSRSNNVDFRFNVLWTILSVTRHAITHSQSILAASKIRPTDCHFSLFGNLFDFEFKKLDAVEVQLNLKKFEGLIDRLSEFGFQSFKIACIEDGIDWNVYDNRLK